jgi:hypothetical protein
MANHQNFFSTNLTSPIIAGATTTPLNSIPTVDAPFYLTLDATGLNSHQEVIYCTSKTATNVNHAATTYAHTVAEEVRMDVVADELDALYSANETTGIYRNALINGNFDVWQRAVSFTTTPGYTADRWYYGDTGSSRTITRDTDVPNTVSKYSLKNVWVSGGGAKTSAHNYRIEGVDASKFSGKTVTLSFYAKASVTAGTIVGYTYITYATAADNFATTEIATALPSFAVTGSWAKYTWTVTLPATSTGGGAYPITNGLQLTIQFNPDSNATITTYISQMELNEGDVALPFQPKSFEEELRACQRYFQQYDSALGAYTYFATGQATSTTQGYIVVPHKVTMRIAPALTSSAANTFASKEATLSALTLDVAGKDVTSLNVQVASGWAAKGGIMIFASNSTSSYLGFSAEL